MCKLLDSGRVTQIDPYFFFFSFLTLFNKRKNRPSFFSSLLSTTTSSSTHREREITDYRGRVVGQMARIIHTHQVRRPSCTQPLIAAGPLCPADLVKKKKKKKKKNSQCAFLSFLQGATQRNSTLLYRFWPPVKRERENQPHFLHYHKCELPSLSTQGPPSSSSRPPVNSQLAWRGSLYICRTIAHKKENPSHFLVSP